MVRATVPVVMCDVCGRSELVSGVKVEPVEIRYGEVKVSGDLCEDDAGPVREAIRILPQKGAKRKKRRTFDDSVVASPDDIPRDGG